MLRIDTFLCRIEFAIVCLTVIVAPWLFGAWEMWWFWPFSACIFLSSFIFGIRMLLRLAGRQASNLGVTAHPGLRRIAQTAALTAIAYGVFLVYAAFRVADTEVYSDAERSFLLFLTPALLAVQIAFGFKRSMLRTLTICLLGNLCLLGAYGIINHFVTGSQLVLWSEGYEQYWKDNRASGSYYCPDHFAGALEMGLALGLGILLDRAKTGRWKLAASITCLIAVTGIVMSKSRGAGLTLIVMCAAAMVFGFAQWPLRARWRLRTILATAMIVILGVLVFFPSLYMDRFTRYFSVNTKVEQKIVPAILEKIRHTSRGVMISAALRAWEEQPVFGIGPGMHRNLWPHIAATPDGDRELGIWPSRTNNRTHSYHVHSDWVQLLQEYGSVGFILLLIPVTGGFFLFGMIMHRESKREKVTDSTRRANGYFAAALGGFLAYIAMLFHSLGDFNLQIPANTWLFAVVLTIPMGLALGRRNPPDSKRR